MHRERPSSLGPYVIEGELGRGGMGVVYHGVRRDTGEPAALKTIAVGNDHTLMMLRREIRALARLEHPGIVRILDHGVEGGLPWYAMALIEGTSLRGFVDASSAGLPTLPMNEHGETDQPTRHPEPPAYENLQRSLVIVQRLCEALAYLHSHGLVHRDLKPDNVMVTGEGDPVIVDFGLAARFPGTAGRDTLEVDQAIVGTPAYIAPEQASGDFVDSRADIFAVGRMLYELITGHRFSGDLNLPLPEPPSSRADGIPPELDDLVLSMVQPGLDRRCSHAEDVAAALSTLTGVAHQPSEAPLHLLRPPLVGRHVELETLAAALPHPEGSGSLILMGGETGVGKTRLAMELGILGRSRRIQVLTATGAPPESAAASSGAGHLQPIFEEILDRCRAGGESTAQRILQDRAPILRAMIPGLAPYGLEETIPDLGSWDSRLRLLRAVFETLAALSREKPHLLILDDLQWADELSLSFLHYLLNSAVIDSHPILILALFRTDDHDGRLDALCEHPRAHQIRLAGLPASQVSDMVHRMLGARDLPREIVDSVSQASDGNAFYVAEYLHAAVDQGILTRSRGGLEAGTAGATDRRSVQPPGAGPTAPGRRRFDLPRRVGRSRRPRPGVRRLDPGPTPGARHRRCARRYPRSGPN